jgi:hypothetical protein
MKKQISILIMAIIAISFSTAYGQAVNNSSGISPTPITCPTDPLNPIAGRPYDYSATINPANGTTFWYATKSTTFTTAGSRVAVPIPADGASIALGATNYMTTFTGATSPTATQVTWTSAGLNGVTNAAPIFMVVEYAGPACANNMKVMKIVPKVAFTVDITNLENVSGNTLAYGAPEDQCFANVTSSSYNSGTGEIDIDYGTNYLYYEVIAANFTDSYSPTFKLTGLSGTQTADIDWGYTKGTYDQSLAVGASGASYTSGTATVTTHESNTSVGVSIYVKVTVHNHGFEGLANEPITLAIEAVDAVGNSDVLPNCSTPATSAQFEDLATQTLNARPTVAPGTTQIPQKP